MQEMLAWFSAVLSVLFLKILDQVRLVAMSLPPYDIKKHLNDPRTVVIRFQLFRVSLQLTIFILDSLIYRSMYLIQKPVNRSQLHDKICGSVAVEVRMCVRYV